MGWFVQMLFLNYAKWYASKMWRRI